MAITFSGLATGLDTKAIINAIMDVEREPLNRLESEKKFLNSRLAAFSDFQDKLNALAEAIGAMDTATELESYSAIAGSDEYYQLTVSNASEASEGSFQVEVVNLAQVQKDVSVGYSDRSSAIFSSGGTITINGTDITIADDSSLNDIRTAINEANDTQDTGVSASIIYDGTDYRLVLTGQDANSSFTVSATGISDGTTALSFSNTQTAEPAEINVDGISITSGSNSIANAIPGVTIDLLKENAVGESTTASVTTDFAEITTKLQAFVTAYNDIKTFIEDQQDADWGHDSGFRTVRNTLQNLLVTGVGTGTYQHLVEIGIKSNAQTGMLSLDTAAFEEALNTDFDSVETMLLGNDSSTGILDQFTSYIDGWTDTVDGLYAGKKQSHDSSVRTLDAAIERMNLRLEQREKTLLAQFTAMENLVSSLNATSSYLAQQTTMLTNLSAGGNNNG